MWQHILFVGLLMGVISLGAGYITPLQGIFHATGLTFRDLLISLLLSSVVFRVVEISKWLRAGVGRQEEVAPGA